MKWYAYDLCPIDWGWDYLPTVEQMAARYAENDAVKAIQGIEYLDGPFVEPFLEEFKQAQEAARAAGWEGDYRNDSRPRVLFLPGANMNCAFQHAFAWKQDNNGTTFVISPYQLTWLED
jgi:hypothetical protein